MNENIILLYVLISIFLMGGFAIAVIWFFTIAQKKIIDTKIKQKEQEINFQKELLENTVNIQDEERERISKELHDDIGSKLNISLLNLQILKKKILNEDSLLQLQRLEDAINFSAKRTREISHEMMPPVLQNFGFKHGLEELQYEINASESIYLNIEGTELIGLSNPSKLLHIYRIIQELISNTIKHAKADKITIDFILEGESINLKYADNGIGYNKDSIQMGSGTQNITTRCQLLSGRLETITTAGNGYVANIKFPNYD